MGAKCIPKVKTNYFSDLLVRTCDSEGVTAEPTLFSHKTAFHLMPRYFFLRDLLVSTTVQQVTIDLAT